MEEVELAKQDIVAPRAGAWVETSIRRKRRHFRAVAPRAGAWVETLHTCIGTPASVSHPVRVRGLKLPDYQDESGQTQSHPVRVRGLKLSEAVNMVSQSPSHPVRVRGLKRVRRVAASFTAGRSPCGCVG